MTMVAIQTWYLEFIEGTSKKFYRVHLTEGGVVSTGWGRLYSSGQCKIDQLGYDDAKAIALRQVYAKAAKGYTMVTDDFKWEIDSERLATSVMHQSSRLLDDDFEKAKSNPNFAGDRAVVARMYDSFIARAEACMRRANDEGFEEVLPEFNELQKAFDGIEEMHSRASTTMGLVNQMLMQKLMGAS